MPRERLGVVAVSCGSCPPHPPPTPPPSKRSSPGSRPGRRRGASIGSHLQLSCSDQARRAPQLQAGSPCPSRLLPWPPSAVTRRPSQNELHDKGPAARAVTFIGDPLLQRAAHPLPFTTPPSPSTPSPFSLLGTLDPSKHVSQCNCRVPAWIHCFHNCPGSTLSKHRARGDCLLCMEGMGGGCLWQRN